MTLIVEMMKDLAYIRYLASLPIFDGVPSNLLSLIAKDMEESYAEGDIVLRQGDAANHLVILLQGGVTIRANDVHLVTRKAHDVIGEQAFINRTTRTANAVALEYVRALVLPESLVNALMADTHFALNLLRAVSEKLAEATNERAIRYYNERMLLTEFRAHLSPQIANRLLSIGHSYGDPRFLDVIILMSDIRSFTLQSAEMPPAQLADQLGAYLEAMVDIVHRREGMVDKFIGDALMAIWGYAPSALDLATAAFDCSVEMVRTAAGMCFGGEPIRIGVGLNAGEVFMGNVGGGGKRQFTVLGMAVNRAARYEKASKTLGAPIVVGEEFYRRLPMKIQQGFRIHPDQPIQGDQPQTIYSYDPQSR